MAMRSSVAKILGCLAILFSVVTSAACTEHSAKERSGEFQGIWLYEFEGSTFLENETKIPQGDIDYDKAAWLDYDPSKIAPAKEHDSYEPGCGYKRSAFALKFIGRKIVGPAGHMGIYGAELKVDKLLSARSLPLPVCDAGGR